MGALATVSAVAALGVVAPAPAGATTVNPVQTTTYDIQTGSNPITFGGATNINTIGNYQPAVIGNLATSWTVTNQGSLKGDTYGVILDTRSTVTNAGVIYGNSNAALYLVAGGNVTNTSAGSITTGGGLYGVKLGGPGGVSNAGTIAGADFGVSIVGVGSVVNTGNISGASVGVYLRAAAGTLTNSGNVTTQGAGHAAQLSNGGMISNQAGGYMGGGSVGALIQGASGSVVNQGSITGSNYGVGLQAGGNVTNLAGGNIAGYYVLGNATFNQGGAAGVYAKTVPATITNAGNITGAGYGVFLASGGNVTNSAGGAITGSGKYGFGPVGYNNAHNGAIGVLVTGAAGAVTNTGAIYGSGYGVKLGAGGTVTNNAGGNISGSEGVRLSNGGTVANAGTIVGLGGSPSNAYGVVAYNAPALVTNSGNISGYNLYAVSLHAGGTVTNTKTGYLGGGIYVTNGNGNVTNDGRIAGYRTGVRFGGYSNAPMTATLTNSGTITAGASYVGVWGYGNGTAVAVTNSGTISGGLVGAYLEGNSTVTNAAGGNITGTNDGVRFGSKYGEAITGSVTNAGTISGAVTGVSAFNDGNVTLTIDNQASGVIKGGSSGVRAAGPTTITNAGLIAGASANGVRIDAAGQVTNTGGNISGGTGGVLILGAGNVSNTGLITGAKADGVEINAGGTVTNTGGAISGGTGGVLILGGPGNVTNSGTIIGANASGVELVQGGSVTSTGGLIQGHQAGVAIDNKAGSVANAGTIVGQTFAGVALNDGGDVTNQAGGNITGHLSGVGLYAPGGNVTNAGTIIGQTFSGVSIENTTGATGAVMNASTGLIQGHISGVAVYVNAGNVTNAGTLTGATLDGVDLTAGGQVTSTGGLIQGAANGVAIYSQAGTVTNAGNIAGVNHNGVMLTQGGNVTNALGASISGNITGVAIYTHAGAVTNAGAISGAHAYGVELAAGGVVTNLAAGNIGGDQYGVYIVGNGTVTNAAGGTIEATVTHISIPHGGAGIAVTGVGVVSNAGNIAGTPSGLFGYGVVLRQGGTVTNTGAIRGGLNGVFAEGPGVVTNAIGATITSGSGDAVVIESGTVTNAGLLTGAAGVFIAGPGTVANSGNIAAYIAGVQVYGNASNGGGVVTNSGNITSTAAVAPGGVVGVEIRGPGVATNSGAIRGFEVGVYLNQDFVDSISGGNVTNLAGGSISGTFDGVVVMGVGNVTNAGVIATAGNATTANAAVLVQGNISVINQAGGAISGGKYGVLGTIGATSVTNAGTITGGVASVAFTGKGASTLTLQTGSVLNGPAVGSTAAGATNALVLTGHGVANNAFVNFQTLAVNASGVWALNGSSAIGATSINSGDLEVGDAGHPGAVLTSEVTVNPGGELSGHGTVAGDVTNLGGTVSPGGTIGTLTISGNLTMNGASTTAIEVAPPSSSSLLVVGGTASVAGALDLETDPGVYRKGSSFTFLDAGAITGTFSTLTATNGLPFEVVGNGTSETAVFLAGNFAATGGTPNQNSIATAFNDIPVGAGDFDPVANALIALGPGAAQNHALDTLGGEIYADTLTAGRDANRTFLGILDQRLTGAAGGASASGNLTGSDPAVWGQATGQFAQASGDGNAHGFNGSAGGVAFGVQATWGAATAGAALSWDHDDLGLRNLPQSANLDTVQGALFGEANFAGVGFVDAAGSIGSVTGHGERSIVFAGVSRHASGDFSGTLGGVMLNLGARFQTGAGWIVAPSAGLLYSSVEQGSVRESGAGGADLNVAGRTQSSTASVLAVRFTNMTPLADGALNADVRLAWRHDFSDLAPRVSEGFPITPGATFMLVGDQVGRDAALISGGLSYKASGQLSIFGDYNATLSNRETDQVIDLGVRFRW